MLVLIKSVLYKSINPKFQVEFVVHCLSVVLASTTPSPRGFGVSIAPFPIPILAKERGNVWAELHLQLGASLFSCPSFQSSDLAVPLFPLPLAKLFYYYFHSSFVPSSSLDPSLEYCFSKHLRAVWHPELPSGTLWMLQRVSYLPGRDCLAPPLLPSPAGFFPPISHFSPIFHFPHMRHFGWLITQTPPPAVGCVGGAAAVLLRTGLVCSWMILQINVGNSGCNSSMIMCEEMLFLESIQPSYHTSKGFTHQLPLFQSSIPDLNWSTGINGRDGNVFNSGVFHLVLTLPLWGPSAQMWFIFTGIVCSWWLSKFQGFSAWRDHLGSTATT